MQTITKVSDYLVTGKFDITTSLKPHEDALESKTLTLRFVMDNVPLRDVIQKALAPSRISWQNSPGRPKFDTWKNGSVIEVNFSSPSKRVKSREESIEELSIAFQKAGLPKDQSIELATKAIDNPEIIS